MSDLGIPASDKVGGESHPSPAAPPRVKLVPALEHAIAVVNFLNEHAAEAAGLAEISGTLKITKSHCRAILMTLAHAGWVKFDTRTKTYQLYSGLLASGTSLLTSPVLVRIHERLTELVRQTRFSCVLSQPQADDSFVVIENLTASRSMDVSHPVGFHFPRDAPAQMRAYMSWQPDERIERWIEAWAPSAYTANSIVTREDLLREIEETRRRGYSRSLGEHFEGMMAFGMPIFGRDGEVDYVFCVMGFGKELPAQEQRIGELMKRTADDIHNAIVARPPDRFLAGR